MYSVLRIVWIGGTEIMKRKIRLLVAPGTYELDEGKYVQMREYGTQFKVDITDEGTVIKYSFGPSGSHTISSMWLNTDKTYIVEENDYYVAPNPFSSIEIDFKNSNVAGATWNDIKSKISIKTEPSDTISFANYLSGIQGDDGPLGSDIPLTFMNEDA